ncbi:MAG: BNR-4 repeat-containing protein, partial [Spirochaetaceae bacterium]|nr:BNR-4 repeat-containing protein [Spirochaetaceae bacterium]
MRRTDLLSSAGSQAATNEAGNKVVTVGRRTHVTWQDVTPEGYFNRVRTLDLDSGAWSETRTLGSAYDDHARAVMVADGDGFLHAILSGHNTPCTYRRSQRANDAADWTEPVPVADGTYPYLVCGPGGDLFLTLRNAERWNGIEMYKKYYNGSWCHVGKVIERLADYPGYAAFHSGFCFGGDGVLHLVSDFYEGFGVWEERGIHQAVAYLQSPDGGRTWRTFRGEPADTPARPCAMDVICQSTGLRHEPMPPPALAAAGHLA